MSTSSDNNTNFNRDVNIRLATPDCYHLATRAKLFERLESQVNSLEDMRWIMGYNHWQTDEESGADSCEV